ncbi:hypothetical protein [Gallibacterium genomosp. 3]|uniref:hypothetical protein n=1 Tax=Gallibacterium genomosp. 3 TaxID=505345 RepID=UPI0012E8B3A0|nr:hypothetical protein [Gallibacterium genomosp. 3]
MSNIILEYGIERSQKGHITVLLYLISQTSKNYKWLDKLQQLINDDFPNIPNVKLSSMGFSHNPIDTIQQLKNLTNNKDTK